MKSAPPKRLRRFQLSEAEADRVGVAVQQVIGLSSDDDPYFMTKVYTLDLKSRLCGSLLIEDTTPLTVVINMTEPD